MIKNYIIIFYCLSTEFQIKYHVTRNVAHLKLTYNALYIPVVPFYSLKLLDLILLITSSNYFAKLISRSPTGAFCNFSLLTSPRTPLISPLASRGSNYCALFQGRTTCQLNCSFSFPRSVLKCWNYMIACTILQLSSYRRLCIAQDLH